MIERVTEFEQDRVELWMKTDDLLRGLSRRVKIVPEFVIPDYDYLKVNPRFLFGLYMIRKSLEKDIVAGGNYSLPKRRRKAA